MDKTQASWQISDIYLMLSFLGKKNGGFILKFCEV